MWQASRLLLAGVVWALLGVLLGGVASARAEGLCTDTWTGGVSGSWGVASDWSAGVPAASSVVCVGSGSTVTVGEAGATAGVLVVEGSLVISAGSLEVSGVLEASKLASLTIEGGGVLSGAGAVDITGTLVWEEGVMSGSGETAIERGASASILTASGAPCEGAKLSERRLVNAGTLTLGSHRNNGGALAMSEGARLENSGTLDDDAYGYSCRVLWATIVESAGSKHASSILNTGTFEESEGEETVMRTVDVPFENQGTFYGQAGGLGFGSNVVVTLTSGSVLKGLVGVSEARVSAADVVATGASLTVDGSGTFSVDPEDTVSVGSLVLREATIAGKGTLDIDSKLDWEWLGAMSGQGRTVLEGGATGEILEESSRAACVGASLKQRTFVNNGTITFDRPKFGYKLEIADGAHLDNNGVFKDESEGWSCEHYGYTIVGSHGEIVNTGLFERTAGEAPDEELYPQTVTVAFENWGQKAGLVFTNEIPAGRSAWGCTVENPSFPKREVAVEGGVCVGSGDLSETQTDFAVGGRGVGLDLARTYNSQAAQEGFTSAFGRGWTFPYSEHLSVEPVEEIVYEEGSEGEPVEKIVTRHVVRLAQENGSTVTFTEGGGESWKAPEGSPDTLTGSTSSGFTLTLETRDTYHFAGSTGRLESITDAFGNTTNLTYNGSGQLEKVTDPSGRSLKFTYNSEGLVKTAKDPMERTIEYTYEKGDLVGVSQPNETALRWAVQIRAA